MHGIHGRRLVYREVVETHQTIRNLTSRDMGGDLTGINQIEKDQACLPPRPV